MTQKPHGRIQAFNITNSVDELLYEPVQVAQLVYVGLVLVQLGVIAGRIHSLAQVVVHVRVDAREAGVHDILANFGYEGTSLGQTFVNLLDVFCSTIEVNEEVVD